MHSGLRFADHRVGPGRRAGVKGEVKCWRICQSRLRNREIPSGVNAPPLILPHSYATVFFIRSCVGIVPPSKEKKVEACRFSVKTGGLGCGGVLALLDASRNGFRRLAMGAVRHRPPSVATDRTENACRSRSEGPQSAILRRAYPLRWRRAACPAAPVALTLLHFDSRQI
jgi:hypothetical protein